MERKFDECDHAHLCLLGLAYFLLSQTCLLIYLFIYFYYAFMDFNIYSACFLVDSKLCLICNSLSNMTSLFHVLTDMENYSLP